MMAERIQAGRVRLRSAMVNFAKILHDAIGIESPRLFIFLFAMIGFIFFGGIGWVIDVGYRKSKESSSPTAHAASPQVTPTPKPDPPAAEQPKVNKSEKPKDSELTSRKKKKPTVEEQPSLQINQSAPGGIASVAMPGSTVSNTVNQGPQRRTLDDAAATRIRAAITQFPPQSILVMFGRSDAEVRALGQRICQILSMPSWNINCPSIQFYSPDLTLPAVGVVLSVSKSTSFAEALAAAFIKEFGKDAVLLLLDPNTPADTVKITVQPQ